MTSGTEDQAPASMIGLLMAQMRQSSPQLFSDTERRPEPVIAREVLDHHLHTLTRRKQEYEFEHFARLLAEKEICPNLRPQTGPTGGGDSKVDSETYPVDEAMAERWYAASAKAGHERWAFAFSAKEAWVPKVRSDVASIMSTDRGYDRIVFITNQYAPDRKRAALEDELTRANGLPVTIHDRSWILEKVYANDRLAIAIEALGLKTVDERHAVRAGPSDTARMLRLEELDRQITDPARYAGARYSLAEDCLSSALLARGLERPRSEVEARLLQARRIAEGAGVREQRVRVLYHQAWTAHWWYEDLDTLLACYEAMEPLVVGTILADDVEKLATLGKLLLGAVRNGTLDADVIAIARKRTLIADEYRRLAADPTRPNTAMEAKFGLELFEVEEAVAAEDEARMAAAWKRIADLAPATEHLMDFPVEAMVRLIENMGRVLPVGDEFETALDAFLPVLQRRKSEAAVGEILLRRGRQRLEAGKHFEAIRLLGRAEIRLGKDDMLEELVDCLQCAADAYLAVGLPWAARARLLLATDRCFALLRIQGDVPPVLVRSLYHLVAVEIRLGRVPQALAAFRHLATMAPQLDLQAEAADALRSDMQGLDLLFGCLLLRSSSEDLVAFERLPDALERLGLLRSSMMLLWALGHEDVVRERYVAEDEPELNVEAMLRDAVEDRAAAQIARRPLTGTGDVAFYVARALGCEFRFETNELLSSTVVAEAAMAAIQSFFATSLLQPLAPWREHLRFRVAPKAADGTFVTNWHDDAPEVWAEVGHPVDPCAVDMSGRTAFSEWLRDMIGGTIARTFILDDLKGWLQRVGGDEEGFSRAVTLANVPILYSSVFGDQDAHRLSHWLEEGDQIYAPLREGSWIDPNGGRRSDPGRPGPDRAGSGRANPFERETGSHDDRRVVSIINMQLWDAARWRGVGLLLTPDAPAPVLALAFDDIDAGVRIFEEWRTRFGGVDEKETIRIALIQGLKSARPYDYAVTVSRSLERLDDLRYDQMLLSLTRSQRMQSADGANLQRFLFAYMTAGRYLLVPVSMHLSGEPEAFRLDLGILKTRLDLRRAWEIGPQDLDLTALSASDDPIIPDHVEDAPVISGLAELVRMRDGGSPLFGTGGRIRGA